MSKYLLLIFPFLFFVSGFAQEQKVDSLNKLLPQVKNENKVDVLAKLSLYYNRDHNDLKKKYAEEARELAQKLNYKKGEGLALYSLAHYYYINSENSKAIETIKDALAINLQFDDSILIARTYSIEALIYLNLSNYTEAIKIFELANQYLGEKEKNRKFINIEGIGIAEYNLANYNNALKHFILLISYYEQTKQNTKLPHFYNLIGGVYIKTGENELGLSYLKKSLGLAKEQKNDFVTTESSFAIGEFYKNENQVDSALIYLDDAINYALKIDQKLLISDIYTVKGDCFLSEQYYDSATIYYNKVIEVSEKAEDPWAIVYGSLGLAKVYKEQGNYGKALYYLHQVRPEAEEINSKKMLQDFYGVFSDTYARSGDYKEAYRYQLHYKEISNSLHDENIAKQIANLKVNYETEKKEQENIRLVAENKLKEQTIKNQEFIVWGIIIILLLVVVFAIVFFRSKERIRKANDLLKEKNQEILNQNEEITAQTEELSGAYTKLKELDEFKQGLTNMIVHDLKNPLNIILNLSQEKLVVEAGNKMLNLITNILDVSKFEEAKMIVEQKQTVLSQLVNIAIEKTSFVAKISNIEIINVVDKDIKVYTDQGLAERTFINLLTNAIKFSPKNDKIHIISQDDRNSNFVKIFVKDSGSGVPKEFQDKIFDRFTQVTAINSASMRSTGLGLTFCKLAVEAHGGKIGVESRAEKGATFWFTLPKH